ncbi:MAG: hypothetical protein NUV82_03490 [Candidatus Komeilibacteria bacterium]|nr:hypothetical protein [Candidatus Komeilibacteria bacterium]
MNKNLAFSLLIVASVLTGFFLFRSPAENSQPPLTIVEQNSPDKIMTLSQDGIDIEIEAIDQRPEATVITLNMNNHSYDLGDARIYETATLNDQTPLQYEIQSSAVGGHHVTVLLEFPSTTQGSLVISPAAQSTFTFENLW